MNFEFIASDDQTGHKESLSKYGNLQTSGRARKSRMATKFFDSADWVMKGPAYLRSAKGLDCQKISVTREEAVTPSALLY